MKKYQSVFDYLEAHGEWQKELQLLRSLLLSTKLKETIKWGAPVYTLDNKNVVGLSAFKSYVGLWFFQGVFLDDKHNMLINAQEGKTKAMRQIRFHSLKEMDEQKLRYYIELAIKNQEAGMEVSANRKKPLVVSPELKEALDKINGLKDSFAELSLSKQREFAEYISEAKKPETKQRRLAKIVPMILTRVGLTDKYK